MKTLILASVAILALSNVAHADSYYSATCGSSVLTVGTYSRDRDVRVSVVYDHGAWRVVHTLSNGHVYERGVQYDLRDATTSFNDGSTKPTWTGVLRRNSSISMTGSLGMRGATLTYDETMTQNGQIIMASEATCQLDGSWQPPAPPPVVTAPPATDHVPFIYAQGGMHVPVSLSGYPATMVIDTGATAMTITETLADQLVSNGQATYTGEVVEVTLADNSKRSEREISINTLTVGGRSIHNVHGHIAPDGSDMLLGITVLARLSPKFAINTAANTLDLD